MTIKEAAQIIARLGNVSKEWDKLLIVKPTESELKEAEDMAISVVKHAFEIMRDHHNL